MVKRVSKKKKDTLINEEKQLLLDPDRAKRNKKKRIIRIAAFCVGIPVTVLILAGAGVLAVGAKGKASLKQMSVQQPQLAAASAAETPTEEEIEIWQDGWVKYQGQIYAYNEDIMTFLFMGIDQRSETVQEVEEGTDGGQADALFLLALNPHDKTASIIGINRNTMTAIDIYNEEGAYVNTVIAQIAVQHGFGNGVEKSCEYQEKAVSRLFYSLPIHGYAAINMSAIETLNDEVGGVDVTVLEDMTSVSSLLKEGETVHLEGKDALTYVRHRDEEVFASADRRLERQKQYLTEFVKAAKSMAKKDITSVVRLYQAVSPMMVTDITADEAVYLASQALDYRIGPDDFYMLKGETVMGEQFEEYNIDEKALYEMILQIFYEPIPQESLENGQ